MLRLPSASLGAEAAAMLAGYQVEVDQVAAYAERVERAKRDFKRRNQRSNPTFRAVRTALHGMCGGIGRCCYCEDAPADEVEHVRPKDFYPELTFVWENYLYACGPCNGPKGNRLAIVDAAAATLIEVRRRRGEPIEPPLAGPSALIDPRSEDPLEFLELDLEDTFYFQPRYGIGRLGMERARHSIELLQLNARDALVKSRRNAFGTYRARLKEYRSERDAGQPEPALQRKIDDLRMTPHPTVWAEMKRQRDLLPELRELFEGIPQALDW